MTGVQFTQGGQTITTYITPASHVTNQPTASQQAPQPPKTTSSQQPTYSLQTLPAGAVTAILAPGSHPTPVTTGQTVQIHQSPVQPQVLILIILWHDQWLG